ncbi:hypothetical protein B296_00017147 [Ensete ventricosum]|uniref:Uncharacterized protein n=1 Tax=Ensete ventricosum TaxID=4639 RepID=A0A426YX36_ENSVE|nr:hypothetical protein B296_00017147 [Ensete ventricosum]
MISGSSPTTVRLFIIRGRSDDSQLDAFIRALGFVHLSFPPVAASHPAVAVAAMDLAVDGRCVLLLGSKVVLEV